MTDALTEDRVLGGRVRLRQFRHGYRVAIDPIVLAAAVAAEAGQSVLDVGCGVGAAALCLAARVPGVAVCGIDSDAEAVRLANVNAAINAMAARVRFHLADLRAPPGADVPATFDHVMTNPPFLRPGAVRMPRHPERRRAMVEGEVPLADWLRHCLARVGARGRLTLIHRADRLDEILALLAGGLAGRLCDALGDIRILPLWPAPGSVTAPEALPPKPAKRIVVSARRGSSAPIQLLPGLVVHGADGRYTGAAQAILRDGSALRL